MLSPFHPFRFNILAWFTEAHERGDTARPESVQRAETVAAGAVGQPERSAQGQANALGSEAGIHRGGKDALRGKQGKGARRSARTGRRQVLAAGSGSGGA